MIKDGYRLYSFVAGLYLSELQKGLQTAHAVSEIESQWRDDPLIAQYHEWADHHKTIVILNALNSKGVKEVDARFYELAGPSQRIFEVMPQACFYEDEDSLNGAATAFGIIVPKKYYDVGFVDLSRHSMPSQYVHVDEAGQSNVYVEGTPQFEFVKLLKSYRLA